MARGSFASVFHQLQHVGYGQDNDTVDSKLELMEIVSCGVDAFDVASPGMLPLSFSWHPSAKKSSIVCIAIGVSVPVADMLRFAFSSARARSSCSRNSFR